MLCKRHNNSSKKSIKRIAQEGAIKMKDKKKQEQLSGKQKKLRDKQERAELPGKNPDDLEIYPEARRLI